MEYSHKTAHNDIINAIHTDLYQITMTYAYYKEKKHEQHSVFELFFRKNPFKGEYVIFCGLSEVLSFLQNYKFTKEYLDFLKEKVFPKNSDPNFFTYLENLDCSKVSVTAFQEGGLVFPSEPLLRVEGPLGIVQMIETGLINLVGFPSLIATNASRFRILAGKDKKLAEFGLRRAQGPDGGLSASQYAYVGGFDCTSNVLAGLRFGIPVMGSMAHSYISSHDSLNEIESEKCVVNGINIKENALKYRELLDFKYTNDGELAAFIAYSVAYPENTICLVDTYDTLASGVPNFICVALALIDSKNEPKGIRLDSGDLATLSMFFNFLFILLILRESKKLFKFASDKTSKDLTKCKVVASNDINEEYLIELIEKE